MANCCRNCVWDWRFCNQAGLVVSTELRASRPPSLTWVAQPVFMCFAEAIRTGPGCANQEGPERRLGGCSPGRVSAGQPKCRTTIGRNFACPGAASACSARRRVTETRHKLTKIGRLFKIGTEARSVRSAQAHPRQSGCFLQNAIFLSRSRWVRSADAAQLRLPSDSKNTVFQ